MELRAVSLFTLLVIVHCQLVWFGEYVVSPQVVYAPENLGYQKSPYTYPPVLPGSERLLPSLPILQPMVTAPMMGFGGPISPIYGPPASVQRNFQGIDPATGLPIRFCGSNFGLRSAQPAKQDECIDPCMRNDPEMLEQCQDHEDCPGQHLCACACDECKAKLCIAARPTKERCTLSSPCMNGTHVCRHGRCWDFREKTRSTTLS
uniref:DUF7107 domain-containing protein n=1 Tax=Trichuris muris TaxID=70415 RepID=A0A5S6Q369_TRIMR